MVTFWEIIYKAPAAEEGQFLLAGALIYKKNPKRPSLKYF
jgi:hypothetical protein